jgi:putative membrane protein
MKAKLITAVALVLQTAALGALAGDKDHSKHDMSSMGPVDSQTFVQKAAVSNMAEIELGQLALKKSQDQEVRTFAERMVKDHTASLGKLKAAAGKDNVTVPTALDSEHKEKQQKLSALSGGAFDEAYSEQMEKAHHKTLALLENAQKSEKVGPSLREYAAATLPTVKTHTQLAEALEDAKDDSKEKTASDR